MPRDDLSIDFVRKMPPVESLDPALILDEWINRTQNLPEELRFLQDEIAEKDRQYDKLIREIEDRDGRIQKWIKAHGSHHANPKEAEYRATIRKNYAQAEQLSNEKIALTQKLQQTMDKHIRQLDMQIKMLYDRGEPGFTDPDELPSLLRPSAANITNGTTGLRGANATNPATALNGITNGASQVRVANVQVRGAQSQHHGSASAPATPAASMIMSRQARESSAGPPKRGPRSTSGLGSLPTTSSGLARHSSLGPGTPKGHQTATGIQRAGSAGPRATSKASGSGAGRKAGTPSSTAGRKKGTPAAGAGPNKSGLSRVKRAARNSPSSTAESELSEAETGSDDDSDARTTGGRGTPAAISRSSSNQAAFGASGASAPGGAARDGAGSSIHEPSSSSSFADGTGGPNGTAHTSSGGGSGGGSGPPHNHHRRLDSLDSNHNASSVHGNGNNNNGGNNNDVMEVDEDEEAGDDRKYCSCQNVSFGNMVACDNDDCPYEWFHWGCVGLKSEPNGTWYCPDCTKSLGVQQKKGGSGGGGGGGNGGGGGSGNGGS
ncbi:Chromatin modification-related protein YNG2 [Madurella mycetomatis]|uniref:Chromatin modification-related protein n=1 Tax=Madurella mycetomatis TaxID=100816 RepID=A0A175VQV0_9PEZI|nr:Chromatin modification-related protein YNG2 [Madurella mycetomatis]